MDGNTGSSPLARGLLFALCTLQEGLGSSPLARGLLFALCTLQEGLGSSPLARGLPRQEDDGAVVLRIIPARAGFTSRTPGSRFFP